MSGSVEPGAEPARGPRPAVRWATVLGAAAVVVALDQLTKAWAVDRLQGRPPIDVVWTLRFNYAENTGMAFSRASGAGPVIAVVALLIVGVVAWSARRMTSPWMWVLAGAVIGGALGNVVDRLVRAPAGGRFLGGHVVDFIDLQWWPVFNVADAAIVVGGIALAIATVREPVEPETVHPDPVDADPVDDDRV